jgi:hypothetical protein
MKSIRKVLLPQRLFADPNAVMSCHCSCDPREEVEPASSRQAGRQADRRAGGRTGGCHPVVPLYVVQEPFRQAPSTYGATEHTKSELHKGLWGGRDQTMSSTKVQTDFIVHQQVSNLWQSNAS